MSNMNILFTFYLILLSSGSLSCYLEHVKIRGKSLQSLNHIYKQFEFDYDSSYHNWTEIDDHLQVLSRQYRNLTKIVSLGKTFENRDIRAVIISNRSVDTNLIVFECGVHAREWISVSFCLWSINKLLEDNRLLDRYHFAIIPVLNPDGYAYSWEMERLWRKNREPNEGSNCIGVDINRNFEPAYYYTGDRTVNPCEEDFYGHQPYSTAEAKALRNYLRNESHNLLAYFAFHSYGQLWTYHSYELVLNPLSMDSSEPTTDDLDTLSEIGVNGIRRQFGTQYKFGHFEGLLYKVSGTSGDWVSNTLNIKLTFTIEMPDEGKYGFILPCYMIKPICLETWAGVEAVLDHLWSASFDLHFHSNFTTIIISLVFSMIYHDTITN